MNTAQATNLFGNTTFKQMPNTSEPIVVNGPASPMQMMSLRHAPSDQIVLFGNDRQKEFGNKLDEILTEITKGSNPVLFQLFDQLSKGVKEVNIPELEEEIRKSQNTTVMHRLLQAVGLSSAAKRLQKANERVGEMLKSKSTSLLDICNKMQQATATEVTKLITDSQRLNVLAGDLRSNIEVFKQYVESGQQILKAAKDDYERIPTDQRSDEEAKRLQDKINLFENRLLVLETILQKAPTDLEAVRIGMNASLQTLGETANSALEDFNDIKGILIKLSVTHQIKTVQSLNEERRKLKDSLQTHANQQLAQVAVDAARVQGTNRLQDAENLLKSAKELNDINVKVAAEIKENEHRRASARQKLTEVKLLLK